MAKKKKIIQVVHPPTKRQLSHWQKQKRRQRVIFTAGMIVIVAVFAIIGTGVYRGWYVPDYKPSHETVIEVNGTKYDMNYYIKALELQLQLQFQGSTQYLQYFLDPEVTSLEQAEVIRQEALKLGISVSDAEIDEQLANSSAATKAEPTVRDYVRSYLLHQKMTNDYFGPQVPASGDQRQILAMYLESKSQADEITARLTAGEDFGTLAAELSLESTTKNDSGDLGWKPKGILGGLVNSTVLEDAVFNQPLGTVGQVEDTITKQIGYWLVKVTEKEVDTGKLHVSGMLLSSLQQAEDVQARLAAGDDFTALAQEYSQRWTDTSKDDLGWFSSDAADVFKDYIFNSDTQLNVVSSPIKDTTASTPNGVWLFKILDGGIRDIATTDHDTLVANLFQQWLDAKMTDYKDKIVSKIDQTHKDYATTRIYTDLGTSG